MCSRIQTRGRGTRGKKWISRSGNLFCSIFFPLKKRYPQFNEFSLINPVLISKSLRIFCKNKNIRFKWPNDVFVNNKKICGILQEVITMNKTKYLIIGIGLNIASNPFIKNKYKATNILNETNKRIPLIKIEKLIISSYEKFFENLDSYNYKDFRKQVELMALN